MRPIVGPELEFYVLERSDNELVRLAALRRGAPATSTSSGLKGDPENVLLRTLRQLAGYGLDVGRREPRVLQRPVRDQPLALRGARRGRPRLPVQDRDQGAGPARGQARDLHGQAVQRRGRLGLPPALLHLGRRRRTRCSTTRESKDGLSKIARHGDRRHPRPRARAGRAVQPDDQLVQAVRPGHPRAVADRLGLGQPQRDGPDPAGARQGRRGWSCGSATPAPTPTWRSPGCWPPRTSASATSSTPPAPLEGYGYDPSKSPMLPRRPRHRARPRSRPTRRSVEILGPELRLDFLAYKRNELDRFNQLGDRLGVPRVRLPPLSRKPDRPATTEGDIVSLPTPEIPLADVDLTDLDAFARNEGWSHVRHAAPRGPGALDRGGGAEQRLLGGDQARRHLRGRPGRRDASPPRSSSTSRRSTTI